MVSTGCTPTGAIIRPRTRSCSAEDVEPSTLDCTFSKHTDIQHDLPDVYDTVDRLPSEESLRGILEAAETLSHMSTPESIITGAGQQQFLQEQDQKLVVGCVRKETSTQLDDMQARITNAQTPASEQEPDVLPPSKRRKLVYLADGFESNIRRSHEKSTELEPKAEILNLEACEDSGLTAEQHTSADRDSSKLSILEDIDSAAHVSPIPQLCILEKQVLGENVEQLSERWPIHKLQLSPEKNVSDSRPSTSQTLVLSAGRTWLDFQEIEVIKDPETESVGLRRPRKARTMANGSRDKWLQLSLGTSPQSDESPGDDEPVREPRITPMQIPTNDYTCAPSTLQSSIALVDFFNSRGLQSNVDALTHDTDVQKLVGPSSSTHTSVGNLEFQFLSPSPVFQGGYTPEAAFSTSPPIHPVRTFQSVKSQQTETTSVNVSRTLPWMQSQAHDSPQTIPPNSAEAVNITTPTAMTAISQDWKSLPSSAAAASVAQGVDNHEQAWRLLLQRVGRNWNGFAPSSSESLQRPAANPPEYLDPDALKRAVGRYQSPETDQGPEAGDSLRDLQLLQRSSTFPHPLFDPNIDVSVANCTLARNGSKARRGPTSSSECKQGRILHPCAPRPGLWFTLQASSCPPEASPLQQIPTVYIRVLDGNMTVAAVMKYLMNKLGLSSVDEVKLTCKGQLLVPSISLSQVRDGIWQAPSITNTAYPGTPQLLSEGKAWKSPDGSVLLVGDVVMVLTYGRQLQGTLKSTVDLT